MTDNEIIKALEFCITNDEGQCADCPAYDTEIGDCVGIPWKSILDLINRQKAEIENYIKVAETQQSLSMERFFEIKRLTERLEKRTTELDRLTIYFDKAVEEKLKTAKAEAIKEFAERLKENCKVIGAPLIINRIDNLVKEMVDGLNP